jgi:hypothetical protein
MRVRFGTVAAKRATGKDAEDVAPQATAHGAREEVGR